MRIFLIDKSIGSLIITSLICVELFLLVILFSFFAQENKVIKKMSFIIK